MPIQDPLTQQIIGLCYRIAEGRVIVEIKAIQALGEVDVAQGTGDMELEVKEIQ